MEGNNANWKLEKTETEKSRNAVRVSVKSVRIGASCTMEGRIWEIGKFWVWNGRMTGWWMIRVVMMILGRWDDCREEMNQEEADQDVVWRSEWGSWTSLQGFYCYIGWKKKVMVSLFAGLSACQVTQNYKWVLMKSSVIGVQRVRISLLGYAQRHDTEYNKPLLHSVPKYHPDYEL